jgi:hypothetical protein
VNLPTWWKRYGTTLRVQTKIQSSRSGGWGIGKLPPLIKIKIRHDTISVMPVPFNLIVVIWLFQDRHTSFCLIATEGLWTDKDSSPCTLASLKKGCGNGHCQAPSCDLSGTSLLLPDMSGIKLICQAPAYCYLTTCCQAPSCDLSGTSLLLSDMLSGTKLWFVRHQPIATWHVRYQTDLSGTSLLLPDMLSGTKLWFCQAPAYCYLTCCQAPSCDLSGTSLLLPDMLSGTKLWFYSHQPIAAWHVVRHKPQVFTTSNPLHVKQ